MNLFQRLVFGAVGAGAIVAGVVRYRLAPRSAEEAARVGMVPRPFRSVATYRLAAVFMGVVGGAFMVLAGFARLHSKCRYACSAGCRDPLGIAHAPEVPIGVLERPVRPPL
jgi:hypothetical protein